MVPEQNNDQEELDNNENLDFLEEDEPENTPTSTENHYSLNNLDPGLIKKIAITIGALAIVTILWYFGLRNGNETTIQPIVETTPNNQSDLPSNNVVVVDPKKTNSAQPQPNPNLINNVDPTSNQPLIGTVKIIDTKNQEPLINISNNQPNSSLAIPNSNQNSIEPTNNNTTPSNLNNLVDSNNIPKTNNELTNLNNLTATVTIPPQHQGDPATQPINSNAIVEPNKTTPYEVKSVVPKNNLLPTFLSNQDYNDEQQKLKNSVAKINEALTEHTKQINELQNNFNDLSQLLNKINNNLSNIDNKVVKLSNNIDYLSSDLKNVKKYVQEDDFNLNTNLQPAEKDLFSHSQEYVIHAVIPGRAWLKSSTGQIITVAEGDQIGDYGKVVLIDPTNNTIRTSSGIVFK